MLFHRESSTRPAAASSRFETFATLAIMDVEPRMPRHRGLIDAENLGDETVTTAALTARTGQPEPPRQEDAGVPPARHPDRGGSYGPGGGRWRAKAAGNDSDGVHGSEAGMARRSPIAQNH